VEARRGAISRTTTTATGGELMAATEAEAGGRGQHNIDVKPFVIAIQGAMKELLTKFDIDGRDYDVEVAVVGQGLINALTGEEELIWVDDEDIHNLAACSEDLENILFDDLLRGVWYDIPYNQFRSNLVWIEIVDRVAKAFRRAYTDMSMSGSVL
jgi:hypothetical protein